MTAALEISGLCKTFGDNVAVDHVDLTIPQGSFYGLVGQNGAGKTTTLSMAVGLLRPDGGSARIFGVDVWSDPAEAKALVGVLPDGMAMPERLTGREVLTYLGLLRGLPATSSPRRAEELLVGAGARRRRERTLVIDYSTGMRKKIGLATALLHAPRLLVLDEPFEAVDPVSAATHQDDPARVRRRRRLDRALQPRHGAGGAALRPRRGDRQGHGSSRRGTAGRGPRSRHPRRRFRRPGRRGADSGIKELSWLSR